MMLIPLDVYTELHIHVQYSLVSVHCVELYGVIIWTRNDAYSLRHSHCTVSLWTISMIRSP